MLQQWLARSFSIGAGNIGEDHNATVKRDVATMAGLQFLRKHGKRRGGSRYYSQKGVLQQLAGPREKCWGASPYYGLKGCCNSGWFAVSPEVRETLGRITSLQSEGDVATVGWYVREMLGSITLLWLNGMLQHWLVCSFSQGAGNVREDHNTTVRWDVATVAGTRFLRRRGKRGGGSRYCGQMGMLQQLAGTRGKRRGGSQYYG